MTCSTTYSTACHTLKAGPHSAVIAAHGAELQALTLAGHNLLWEAGPLWPKHAPLLFPVVGALPGNQLHYGGHRYTMPRHGFARDRSFAWLARSAASCTLALTDDAASRASYPWPFNLQLQYTLTAAGLSLTIALHNPGATPLPASFGLHPAFRWPLAPGLAKASHVLRFEQDEPGALHRLDAAGLLRRASEPTPIHQGVLQLDDDLFREDALLFLEPRSQSLRFEGPEGMEGLAGPALVLQWTGFQHLGLWAKPSPGPAFLCIEPWSGHASPADWEGPFDEKPGAFQVAPGATRNWSFSAALAR